MRGRLYLWGNGAYQSSFSGLCGPHLYTSRHIGFNEIGDPKFHTDGARFKFTDGGVTVDISDIHRLVAEKGSVYSKAVWGHFKTRDRYGSRFNGILPVMYFIEQSAQENLDMPNAFTTKSKGKGPE